MKLFLTLFFITLCFSQTFDIQGHRGCRGLMPENTIPAFIKAVELGVTTLELDIVFTEDHQVVVSHEPYFNHEITLDKDGEEIFSFMEYFHNIYGMTYDEVKQYDVGKKHHPKFPQQEKIALYKPLLVDVIDSVEHYIRTHNLPPVNYNIETKCKSIGDNLFHPEPNDIVTKLYTILNEKNIVSKSMLQSFDVRTLQVAKQKKLPLPLVLLVHEGSYEENIETLGFLPDVYSPSYSLVTKELRLKTKQNNVRLIPWTVNEEKDMKHLISLDVDGIITDYPNKLISILR